MTTVSAIALELSGDPWTSGSEDSQVRIWETWAWACVGTLQVGSVDHAVSMAISAGNCVCATTSLWLIAAEQQWRLCSDEPPGPFDTAAGG